MTDFDTAIFDMDGTLLDTERLYFEAWRTAAREIGQPFTAETYGALIGRSDEASLDLLEKLWGARLSRASFIATVDCTYFELVEAKGIALRPGVKELLGHLETRGAALAVATSTVRAQATAHLQAAGIFDRFQVLVGGDEVTRRKPAPDIFHETLRRLGRTAGRTLIFEDSPAGVEAAVTAGLRCIWVPDFYHPTPEEARRAFAHFQSFHEVHGFLQRDGDAAGRV